MRAPLTAVALLLLVAGCGSIGAPGTQAATASSVAVKGSDLPSDMHRCDLSGSINDYLKKIQTKDPTTYTTIKAQWAAAQKDGATSADVEFYTDSAAHCTALESNGSQIGTATYKLVVNFVFEFKDQASAEKGYSSDSIFGFSAAESFALTFSANSWRECGSSDSMIHSMARMKTAANTASIHRPTPAARPTASVDNMTPASLGSAILAR